MDFVFRPQLDDRQSDAVLQWFTWSLVIVRQPDDFTAPVTGDVGKPRGQIVKNGVNVQFRSWGFHDLARKIRIHGLVITHTSRLRQDRDQFIVKAGGDVQAESADSLNDTL